MAQRSARALGRKSFGMAVIAAGRAPRAPGPASKELRAEAGESRPAPRVLRSGRHYGHSRSRSPVRFELLAAPTFTLSWRRGDRIAWRTQAIQASRELLLKFGDSTPKLHVLFLHSFAGRMCFDRLRD